jgi:hypothetical protein
MIKKLGLFLVVISIVVGCSKKDPMSQIQFGNESVQSVCEKMTSNGTFIDSSEYDNEYIYFLNNKFKGVAQINYQGYDFGLLENITIDLGGDSIYIKDYNSPLRALAYKGRGPRNISDFHEINSILVEWYGNPNDSIKKLNWLGVPEENSHVEYIWKQPNFEISLERNAIKVGEYRPFEGVKTTDGIRLTYSAKNKQSIKKHIVDSIRGTLKPNDIVGLVSYAVKWTIESNMKHVVDINLRRFEMLRPEEQRKVNAFKLDLILKNSFGEEVHRFSDLMIKTREPLVPATERIISGSSDVKHFSKSYNPYSIDEISLEDARKLREKGLLRIQPFVTAVSFVNGEFVK